METLDSGDSGEELDPDDEELDDHEPAQEGELPPDAGFPDSGAELPDPVDIDTSDVDSNGIDDTEGVPSEALEQSRSDGHPDGDENDDGTPDGDELVERFLDGVTRSARGESPELLPALD